MRRRPHPGILRQDRPPPANPGGDRQANHALWRIVFTRLGSDPATRAYAERRTAEGKSKKEIIRCLKRDVAREVYPHLRTTAGEPALPGAAWPVKSAAATAGLRTIRLPSPAPTWRASRAVGATPCRTGEPIGGLLDLVDRQFAAPEPDQLWVGDITYISTYSGFAYLATLIDMCSNKVVGWAVDDHMRTGLVLEAVDNALAARGPGIVIGGLVVHHDRGSQYTSGRYRDRLFAEGIIPSVGHTGICYDNAAAESFNATIKKELIYQHVWRDAGEVRSAVFDYIERYYNRVRKQRRLGKISPADYERQLDNWAQKAA